MAGAVQGPPAAVPPPSPHALLKRCKGACWFPEYQSTILYCVSLKLCPRTMAAKRKQADLP